jgi:hypothetical protein
MEVRLRDQSTIYLLIDPRDGLIRYVGSTSRPVRVRFLSHRGAARRGSHHPVAVWVRGLLDAGLDPLLVPLDSVPASVAGAAEDYWITFYLDGDAPLLNAYTRRANPYQYVRWRERVGRPLV